LKVLQRQEIRDAAIETLKVTISTHDIVRQFVLDKADENVLSWLLANKSQNNHNKARKKHQASTGEWFVQSEALEGWISSPKSSLWLYGKAGSGKTILCSTVIEHVLEMSRSSPDFHCAYFYFDFQSKWNVDDMLRSVVAQLCRSIGEVPRQLHQLYQECQRGQPPFTSSLIEILLLLANASTQMFLILDALDECGVESERVDLLQALEGLIKDSKVLSLFVTSRKERDIERSLEPVFDGIIGLEENVIQSDIDLYVRSMLNNDVDFQIWDEETKAEIERTLVKGADGMYPPKFIF
jgi:Cdc6-like AAA superfamily ATPase